MIVVAVMSLGACGLFIKGPPNLAEVEVTMEELCEDISAQTTSPTCPFPGVSDPVDIVCQSPSKSDAPTKRIKWSSGNGDFLLEFPNGNPFVNTAVNGPCDIATKSTTFTCVIRADNPGNPLASYYKYDIVFPDILDCRKDPIIIMTR